MRWWMNEIMKSLPKKISLVSKNIFKYFYQNTIKFHWCIRIAVQIRLIWCGSTNTLRTDNVERMRLEAILCVTWNVPYAYANFTHIEPENWKFDWVTAFPEVKCNKKKLKKWPKRHTTPVGWIVDIEATAQKRDEKQVTGATLTGQACFHVWSVSFSVLHFFLFWDNLSAIWLVVRLRSISIHKFIEWKWWKYAVTARTMARLFVHNVRISFISVFHDHDAHARNKPIELHRQRMV